MYILSNGDFTLFCLLGFGVIFNDSGAFRAILIQREFLLQISLVRDGMKPPAVDSVA